MENGELGSQETIERLLEALGYSIEIKYIDKYSSDVNERQRIIDILRCFKKNNEKKYGIESMALFGSVSRGEQNENSDIDVLISLNAPSLYLFTEIEMALKSVLKRNIDLVSAKAKRRKEFDDEISKDLIYV